VVYNDGYNRLLYYVAVSDFTEVIWNSIRKKLLSKLDRYWFLLQETFLRWRDVCYYVTIDEVFCAEECRHEISWFWRMRPAEVCWIRCQASCSISLGRIKTSIQRCRKWVMGSENEEDVDNIEFELSRYIWPRWRHGSLFQHVTYKFFSKKKAALGRKLSDGYSHSLQRDGNAYVEGVLYEGQRD